MKLAFVLLNIITLLYSFTLEIPVQELEYKFEKHGQFDRIAIGFPNMINGQPGSPELPFITYSYLLPREQKTVKIEIKSTVWEEIEGTYNLYPVQKPVSIETVLTWTEPDPEAYSISELVPASPLNSYLCGNLRGYRVLQIQILPFRYQAMNKKLWILKQLALDIHVESDVPGFAPFRSSQTTKHKTIECLSDIIINKDFLNNPVYQPLTTIQNNEKDSLPSDFPSLIGPPVDLLIITDNSQLNAYRTLAEYKKKSGFNTVVKTMDWIRQNYNGHNDAERMRSFIRDAYRFWGVLYILLGGDTPYVPSAYVWIDRTVIYSELWLPIASDLYFCDLDGSWNKDGDDRLGEVEDSLDLYPDVFVGRLPTRKNSEVINYLEKEKKYFNPGNAMYQNRAFSFSSNLENNWPGLPWATDIMNRLPLYWTKRYLDESLGNLTHQALYDSIHNGFNVMVAVGHGDVNQMDIRHCSWPRLHITNFFYDSLRNDPLYPGLLTVVTCYTNPFQGDCMGEHWVLNPVGGGLAYQGPTSSSEGNIHKEYVKYFVDNIFKMPMAQASCVSKIPFITSSQTNNWFRVHQFSLSLLGDPTIVLWKNCPDYFNTLAIGPDTIRIGLDTITVDVDIGIDPSRFSVVLYKPGEVFIIDSTYIGHIDTEIETETAGYLYCSVKSDGYVMYQDSLLVSGGPGYADYRGHVVLDSSGNGNGMINPGENIGLRVEVGNGGSNTTNGVWARLISYDTLVVVTGDSVWYGDITPGDIVLGMPFLIAVGVDIDDGVEVMFGLELHGSFGVALDSFLVMCYDSRLIHFGQVFGGQDTVWVLPKVVNIGKVLSDSVFGYVVGVNDSGTVLDSVVSFGMVGIGKVVSSIDSLLFVSSGGISYDYELRAGGVVLASYPIDLALLGQVEGLRASGGNNSIFLTWGVLAGALGYRVYRCVVNGDYELQNKEMISGCYYEDCAVLSGIGYEYYVVGVDSGYNIGLSSDSISGRLNPPLSPGWPQVVYDYIFSSPNFGDIDPYYPGLEIAVCGWDGCVYAWHCDGTKLGNNDGRIFYSGADRCWCSPAIADINNDGLTDIIFAVQRSSNNLYALTYTPGDSQAVVLPGWPRTLTGGGIVSSPVLADIDEDGDLEIFVCSSFPANLYAFHHDGSGVYDSQTGLLARLFGTHKGGPAIGDLNNDGHLEIVCGGGSETNQLFVFDRYGQYLPPFPVEIRPNQAFSCVIGNISGDSRLEICFYTGSPSNCINVVNHQGILEWQYPILADFIEMAPALADVDDDGLAEVFVGYNDGLDAGLIAFDNSGSILPGFPVTGHDASSPVIADLDNNGIADIITGTTEWELQAYDMHGLIVPGFPISLGQSIKSTPAVFDIDCDSQLELMISCYDFAFHVFDLISSAYFWPCYQYDPYNSGWYQSGFFPVDESGNLVLSALPGLMIFPSPFKEALNIKYNIPQSFRKGSIKIYDVTGRVVRDFTKELHEKPGIGSIVWRGEDECGRVTASGVYFIQIQNDLYQKTCKIIKIH